MQTFGDKRDWFPARRLGLFVHWGLYAINAWHEQEQWRRGVPRAEYARLIERFNPTGFDPEAWLDLAEAAGMEYLCFTTKHHDGFCLWDTKQTDFNVLNSPCGRDLLAELAAACQRRGLPLCIYYSVVDWRHPAYPNQGRHHELAGPEPGDMPDWDAYMAFVTAQVRELCTNYGEIHGFWWDMNVPKHRDPRVNAMIRKLQPAAVINNRGFDDGDFGTPERNAIHAGDQRSAFTCRTEACQSVGMHSWGYKEDEDYFTPRYLTGTIDRTLSRGANFLLNVGPTAEGVIPAPSAARLRGVGDWYNRVREAFDETTPAPDRVANPEVLVTHRGTTLYLHVPQPLSGNGLVLAPLVERPASVTLLNNDSPIDVRIEVFPYHHDEPPCLHLVNLPDDLSAREPLVVRIAY